jgi:hypothetical protein
MSSLRAGTDVAGMCGRHACKQTKKWKKMIYTKKEDDRKKEKED